jgi:hypothetical protein
MSDIADRLTAAATINRSLKLPIYCAIWAAFYQVSVWLSFHYWSGDQVHYTAFWDMTTGASLSQVPAIQLLTTGSVEPLYGLIVWIGTHVTDKPTLMSIANATLCLGMVVYLRRIRVYWIVYPLIFTNFYLIVLLFAAERLKFSCLALLLFFLIRSRARYVFLAAAPLLHFQSVLMMGGYLAAPLKSFMAGLAEQRLRLRSFMFLLLPAVLVAAVFLIFSQTIGYKVGYYAEYDLGEIGKTLVFLAVSVAFARDRLLAILMFVPVIAAAYLFGDDRINLVAFFFAMYFLLPSMRGLNPVTLVLLGYFSIRGVIAIQEILRYGTIIYT